MDRNAARRLRAPGDEFQGSGEICKIPQCLLAKLTVRRGTVPTGTHRNGKGARLHIPAYGTIGASRVPAKLVSIHLDFGNPQVRRALLTRDIHKLTSEMHNRATVVKTILHLVGFATSAQLIFEIFKIRIKDASLT